MNREEPTMGINPRSVNELSPDTLACYRNALNALKATRIPFLVGGAYALAVYAGVIRHTKDFDVFVRPKHCERVLSGLARVGYQTELTFPHWVGKAFLGNDFIDVIFSSGNGLCRVDDEWFRHAVEAEILGIPLQMVPAEEMIWSKGFVQERERFDGADITHLIRARGDRLDWDRLLRRFGPNWRVLFGHLLVFGYVYPGEREQVPAWVLEELMERLRQEQEQPLPGKRLCRGTLLSREQYLVDVQQWGYVDARLGPGGSMNAGQVALWTDAIQSE